MLRTDVADIMYVATSVVIELQRGWVCIRYIMRGRACFGNLVLIE